MHITVLLEKYVPNPFLCQYRSPIALSTLRRTSGYPSMTVSFACDHTRDGRAPKSIYKLSCMRNLRRAAYHTYR